MKLLSFLFGMRYFAKKGFHAIQREVSFALKMAYVFAILFFTTLLLLIFSTLSLINRIAIALDQSVFIWSNSMSLFVMIMTASLGAQLWLVFGSIRRKSPRFEEEREEDNTSDLLEEIDSILNSQRRKNVKRKKRN